MVRFKVMPFLHDNFLTEILKNKVYNVKSFLIITHTTLIGAFFLSQYCRNPQFHAIEYRAYYVTLSRDHTRKQFTHYGPFLCVHIEPYPGCSLSLNNNPQRAYVYDIYDISIAITIKHCCAYAETLSRKTETDRGPNRTSSTQSPKECSNAAVAARFDARANCVALRGLCWQINSGPPVRERLTL